MKPPVRIVIACSLLFVLSVGTATVSGQRNEPSRDASQSRQLNVWRMPGAKKERSVVARTRMYAAADYMIDKPFETVWDFYAKKLGSKRDYNPGETRSEGHADSKKGIQFTVDILNSSSERSGVRSSTLIKREKHNTIVVHISRGKDEEKTYFTLVIQSE